MVAHPARSTQVQLKRTSMRSSSMHTAFHYRRRESSHAATERGQRFAHREQGGLYRMRSPHPTGHERNCSRANAYDYDVEPVF
jgi:hypothetical protein